MQDRDYNSTTWMGVFNFKGTMKNPATLLYCEKLWTVY